MPPQPSDARRPSILLIDNAREDFQLLTEACREFGFAADVELILDADAVVRRLDAMHRASQRLPDLILLDIHLPTTNGQAVLSRIKRDARFRRIPVVMYTASSRHEDRTDTKVLGACGYVTKPSAFDEYGPLVSILRGCIVAACEPMPVAHDGMSR